MMWRICGPFILRFTNALIIMIIIIIIINPANAL